MENQEGKSMSKRISGAEYPLAKIFSPGPYHIVPSRQRPCASFRSPQEFYLRPKSADSPELELVVCPEQEKICV